MGYFYSSCKFSASGQCRDRTPYCHNYLHDTQYFTVFKHKSLDSYEFKATLLDFFSGDSTASKALQDLDWDTWFYKPGFPPKPDYDTSMVDACYALAEKWEALNTSESSISWRPSRIDILGWSANQSVVFLEKIQTLSKPLKPELVDEMGGMYKYSTSENVELVSRYCIVGLKAKAQSVYGPTVDLLGRVGRMKFVRPLYRGLKECDDKLAKTCFERNKDFYHPICRGMVEKDLFGEGRGG